MIVDVGLIGDGRLESPLGGVVGIPSLDGDLGQTIGVEVSSIELVVLFVQYGIDDGHLALLGLLDSLMAHHHLDAPAGVVVLLLEIGLREVEGAHGGDALDEALLPVGTILVGVVGGPAFFVGQVVDGDGWHVGDQFIGRGEAEVDRARLLLLLLLLLRRNGDGGTVVGLGFLVSRHHLCWACYSSSS